MTSKAPQSVASTGDVSIGGGAAHSVSSIDEKNAASEHLGKRKASDEICENVKKAKVEKKIKDFEVRFDLDTAESGDDFLRVFTGFPCVDGPFVRFTIDGQEDYAARVNYHGYSEDTGEKSPHIIVYFRVDGTTDLFLEVPLGENFKGVDELKKWLVRYGFADDRLEESSPHDSAIGSGDVSVNLDEDVVNFVQIFKDFPWVDGPMVKFLMGGKEYEANVNFHKHRAEDDDDIFHHLAVWREWEDDDCLRFPIGRFYHSIDSLKEWLKRDEVHECCSQSQECEDDSEKELLSEDEEGYFPIGDQMAIMKKTLRSGQHFLGHDAVWWSEKLKQMPFSNEYVKELTGV